jgi:hypothetical protein
VTEPPSLEWGSDAERTVNLDADDFEVLPDRTDDETDRGWGERPASEEDWLLAERPPHWD